jgi:long-chain fatty acid transport protein
MKASSAVRATMLFLALALALPAPARAGGIEVGDQNPRAAGRGGAFTARADDPTAMEYNPGALALQRGTHIFVANRFILGSEWYRRARTLDWSEAFHGVPRVLSFDPVKNAIPNQYLGPMIMVSSDLGLKDWGFAVGLYAPPGTMSQKFPIDGPQKYMLTERTVQILYYNVAAAWKYKDVFGIGLTFQWVDLTSLKFNLVIDGNTSPRLVEPARSRFDILSQVKGADHVNATAILGLWYRPVPNLQLAASARLVPVWFKAKAHLSIRALNLKLDKPPVLSRDGKPDDSVTFGFTVPPRLRVGGRYVFQKGGVEQGDIELDFGYEAWSMLDAYTLDGTGLVSTVLGQNVPIGKIIVPRHWKDVYSLRLGGDWNVLPGHVTLRGGFTWESSAAPDAYAYVDIFPGQRFGPSGGFSLSWWGVELAASYSYVFAMPVAVTESESRVYQQTPGSPCQAPYDDPTTCSPYYAGRPGAVANAGTYVSHYHLVSVSLGYRF